MRGASGQVNPVARGERVLLSIDGDAQLALEDPKTLVFGVAMRGVGDPRHVVPFIGLVALLMKPSLYFLLRGGLV
jgi:hypothetical protein